MKHVTSKTKAWAIAADYDGARRFMGIFNFMSTNPLPCFGLRTAMFSTRREAEKAMEKLGDWPCNRRAVRVNVTINTIARRREGKAA